MPGQGFVQGGQDGLQLGGAAAVDHALQLVEVQLAVAHAAFLTGQRVGVEVGLVLGLGLGLELELGIELGLGLCV